MLAVCRTSNPGSGDVQDLLVDGTPLYQRVARLVAERWAALGECGLVVGATFPRQLAEVRAIVDDLPILVPAVGEQGGDLDASVRAGSTGHGTGLIVSSSRSILYASRVDPTSHRQRVPRRSPRAMQSAPCPDLGGFRLDR